MFIYRYLAYLNKNDHTMCGASFTIRRATVPGTQPLSGRLQPLVEVHIAVTIVWRQRRSHAWL